MDNTSLHISETNMYTYTNDGNHSFALFLVRNRRYVTNLIPNHVCTSANISPSLSLSILKLYTDQPFCVIPAECNEFHAIGRAWHDAADLNLDDRKGDRTIYATIATIRPLILSSTTLSNPEDKRNR